jgi:hypothetical protein
MAPAPPSCYRVLLPVTALAGLLPAPQTARSDSLKRWGLPELVAFSDVVAIVESIPVKESAPEQFGFSTLKKVTVTFQWVETLHRCPCVQVSDVGRQTLIFWGEAREEYPPGQYLVFLAQKDARKYALAAQPDYAMVRSGFNGRFKVRKAWLTDKMKAARRSPWLPLPEIRQVVDQAIAPDQPQSFEDARIELPEPSEAPAIDSDYLRLTLRVHDLPGRESSEPGWRTVAGWCAASDVDPGVLKQFSADRNRRFTVHGCWKSGCLMVERILDQGTGREVTKASADSGQGS